MGTDDAAEGKEHRAAEREHWRRTNKIASNLNWISLIGSIVSLLGLGILYGTLQQTKVQAIAAVESNKAAVDALHQSQRPWVSADKLRIIRSSESTVNRLHHTDFSFGIIFKNTGTSTATKGFAMAYIASGINGDVGEAWDKSCPDTVGTIVQHRERYQTGFVLAPGQSEEIRELTGSDAISHEAFIRNGFWLLGCAIYSDGFGIWHHTRFCFVADIPKTDDSVPDLVPCGTAEEAD